MRKIILLLILLLSSTQILAQDKLKTPNSEVEDCIKYLVGEDVNGYKFLNEFDKPYIRFLSTYAIKNKEERQNAILVCSFILHSLVGPAKDFDSNNGGAFYPLAKMENGVFGNKEFKEYHRVPFSDTLWWIDLRDYNFTPEAWEVAAGIDGYFVTPIVQEQNNGALRLLAGNAILRMDWFITQVTDTTRQRDIERNFDLYNTFLFAQVGAPKKIDDWQKLFNLDTKKAREIGNEYGTLVTKSKLVARHNRMLFGYKTELGYMYDTFDVKNQEGKRDYFESFFKNPKPGTPPEVSDAGEVFGTNQLGLQVYALFDGQGNIVNFGDPTVVRHLADVFGDVRVRVGHSCIDCHATGPLPAENTHKELLEKDADIYLYKKEDKNRVKRVFLDDKFENSVEVNRQAFSYAVERTNGLAADATSKLYLDVIKNYCKDVDLERAAFECGVSKEQFLEKVRQGKFGGRLKLLIETGQPIPIDIWETRGAAGIPGSFQQAMALIYGLTEVKNEVIIEPVIKKYITIEQCALMNSSIRVDIVPKDINLIIIEEKDGWLKTEYNGKQGWINGKFLKKGV
jgi:hypothetical protein